MQQNFLSFLAFPEARKLQSKFGKYLFSFGTAKPLLSMQLDETYPLICSKRAALVPAKTYEQNDSSALTTLTVSKLTL